MVVRPLPTKSNRFFTSSDAANTETSPDQSNKMGYTKLLIDIDVSSMTGTSVTVTAQGKNEEDSTYYTLIADAAITEAGQSQLYIDPSVTTVTGNFSVAVPVPRVWRISVAKSAITALAMTARYTLLP